MAVLPKVTGVDLGSEVKPPWPEDAGAAIEPFEPIWQNCCAQI